MVVQPSAHTGKKGLGHAGGFCQPPPCGAPLWSQLCYLYAHYLSVLRTSPTMTPSSCTPTDCIHWHSGAGSGEEGCNITRASDAAGQPERALNILDGYN